MSSLLQAIAVSKHFAQRPGVLQRLVGRVPDGVVVRAVDRVSLGINAGEIFGLVGQSGSGKTTLVRTLLRLTEPTSGHVLFQGHDVSALSAKELKHTLRRKARMLFQHPDAALNPAFTVAMIIDEALRAHTDLSPSARRDRTDELLHDVGLAPHYVHKYPHQLSGGEKRRVSISRALATHPALLVADEPVSGLDVPLQGQILDLLARLRAEHGVGLLLISHDVHVVRRLCDRIGVMYAGRLVEVGPLDTVTGETCLHPYTRALYRAELTLAPRGMSPPWSAPVSPELPERRALAAGCPYVSSCLLWRELGRPERCLDEHPELESVAERHEVACHFARPMASNARSVDPLKPKF